VVSDWDRVLIAERNGCSERPPRAAGEEVTRSRQLSLPVAAHAPRLARRATSEALLAWGIVHVQETAALLVSELVTNAVRHTRTGSPIMVLRLEAALTTLRIEVQDADPRLPQPRRSAGMDESGFGFVLVEALACKWGLRDTPAGKAIWAEVDT
jgi:anti-sigma regulatory factor (Ser/Thr protein kinase)